MGREIGHEKSGGRQKGTPNKTTTELRLLLQGIIEENYEQFKLDLANLKPKERVDVMLKIFSMIVPRYNNIQLNETESQVSAREFLQEMFKYENDSKAKS